MSLKSLRNLGFFDQFTVWVMRQFVVENKLNTVMRCPVCNQLTEIADVHCIQCRSLLKPHLVKTVYEEKKMGWRDKLREISIYILISIACLALLMFALRLSLAIVTPQSYLMDFFIKYLAVPLGIVLGIALRNNQQQKDSWRKSTWLSLITNFIAGYLLLAMVLSVFILWINAAFVRDETLVISGKVLYKEIIDKRKAPDENLIYLQTLEDEQNISLDIPHDFYVQVPLGAEFSACYKIGLLGIPFQWRKNYQGSCSYSYESISRR